MHHGSPDAGASATTLADLEARVAEQAARIESLERQLAAPPSDVPGEAPAGTEDAPDRRSFLRRGAAAAGVLAGGAAVATAVATPAAAANGDPLILGATAASGTNTATAQTGLRVTGNDRAYGIGVVDNSLSSFGHSGALAGHASGAAFDAAIVAVAQGDAAGILVDTDEGPAIEARSDGDDAIWGSSDSGRGVVGTTSSTSVGVYGFSNQGAGAFFTGARAALQLGLRNESPLTAGTNRQAGDVVAQSTQAGAELWVCTGSGNPGTWRKLAGASTAGALHVLPATARVYDSRPEFGPFGVTKGLLAADQERPIDAKVVGAVPAGAVAALVNLTIVSASASGWLAAFRNGIPWPGNSSLNWDRSGAAVANGAVVALDAAAVFRVRASNATHLLVDVIGYYR